MKTLDGSVFEVTLGGLEILHLLVTQVDDARDLLVIDFLSIPDFLSVTGDGSPIGWKILIVSLNSFVLVSFLAAAGLSWEYRNALPA